jgi:diphthamide synthase (EF-2-diphthine--ammonia ligase)
MALQRLQADSRWRVVGLLTTVNRSFQRIAMHGVRRDVLEAQAASLGLPVVVAELDWPSSNDAYEAAFAAALTQARERWPGLRHIAFGDLFLEDVRAYREKQLAPLGWDAEFPLWGEDTTALAHRFIAEGHRAWLCCVDTQQLHGRFAGHAFDARLLAALPEGADPCGERGEFHTLSFGGPLFEHDLPLRQGESVMREERFHYCDFILDD